MPWNARVKVGPLVYNRPLGRTGPSSPAPTLDDLRAQHVQVREQVQDIRQRNVETRRLWWGLPTWAMVIVTLVVFLILAILIVV